MFNSVSTIDMLIPGLVWPVSTVFIVLEPDETVISAIDDVSYLGSMVATSRIETSHIFDPSRSLNGTANCCDMLELFGH